ncbi:hypothetical protein U6A24_20900 [Aquimarina gracilis]|uniref:STAS/SEC14 domain-containing protein n=1 Tax=Aquimarina gracilis TaxID=874422 RepID=A0ABU6A1H1_9FLAO|nr:hypothetical protein [Aquimarina gracilis]MEB3347946.1 hypothetical protein [Aquimarina gracilis]
MIISYDFGYCRAEIYEDHIRVYINEGSVVGPENITELNYVAEKHFKNKPFVYLAVRIHSYTINPMIYFESNKIQNLLGVAIISKDPKQRSQARIEKAFTNKKLQQFETIGEALEWKDEIIKNFIYNQHNHTLKNKK